MRADTAAGAVECNHDVPPEPHRVVVLGVQRQPRDWPPRAPHPVGEQGGLAEAGRRAHQDHIPGEPGVEFLDQSWSVEVFADALRDVELGREQPVTRTGCGFVPGRGPWLTHRITRRRSQAHARTSRSLDSAPLYSSRTCGPKAPALSRCEGLLADTPIDALAEQIGVPVVAGVLLDHVDEKLAQ